MFGELLIAESKSRRRDVVALRNIYRMEMVYICTEEITKGSTVDTGSFIFVAFSKLTSNTNLAS